MVSTKHFLMANNSLSSLEPGDGCCTGLRGGSTTPSVLLNSGEHRSDATQKSTLTPEIADRVVQKRKRAEALKESRVHAKRLAAVPQNATTRWIVQQLHDSPLNPTLVHVAKLLTFDLAKKTP
jgi:hypothetical protein